MTSFGTDTGASSQDGLTSDTTPTFTWSSSTDDSGILGYWWAIDNATPESGGTFTSNLTATAVVAQQGPHTFYVRAVDASPNANLSPVARFPFTIDVTAPQVVSVTPASGLVVQSGPQTIELHFSEPMSQSVKELVPTDLLLSGVGVGQAWVEVNDAAGLIHSGFVAYGGEDRSTEIEQIVDGVLDDLVASLLRDRKRDGVRLHRT